MPTISTWMPNLSRALVHENLHYHEFQRDVAGWAAAYFPHRPGANVEARSARRADVQAADTTEVRGIAGHERQAVFQGRRRDQRVGDGDTCVTSESPGSLGDRTVDRRLQPRRAAPRRWSTKTSVSMRTPPGSATGSTE